MQLDDHVCLCFHVSKRKIVNHIRVHRPQKASQLSECFGAGTGCGWCQPFLQRLMETATDESRSDDDWPDKKSYQAGRREHRKRKGLDE